jgi:uncharacterized protein with HEPN domain
MRSRPTFANSGSSSAGVEIISEASRHLPHELKARHPEIPWPKVASIGNVLRHNYENIAAEVMWALVRDDLPTLEKVCRAELTAAASADADEAPDPDTPTPRHKRTQSL